MNEQKMEYDIFKKMSQFEYDKYSKIVDEEIKKIRGHPHWVAAWWKPKYRADRILELIKNINSMNKDIEYIEQYNEE